MSGGAIKWHKQSVDDFLDDEQAGDTLTDILRRIDNVIGDTQLMLGDDLPVEPWRWYQLLGILALI